MTTYSPTREQLPTGPVTATYDTVAAEDAPTGVQLWPTRSPEYAPNFTLEAVSVVRRDNTSYVEWLYQNGTVRRFRLGEQVVIRTP